MAKPQTIDVGKVRSILLNDSISNADLNKLFYYSLVDSSSFEDEESSQILQMLDKHKEEARQYFFDFFNRHDLKIDNIKKRTFERFEGRFIGNDEMCKILLKRQLSVMGLQVNVPSQKDDSPNFDLLVDGMLVELKRICTWGGYRDYFVEFLRDVDEYVKRDANAKFLFLVDGAHSFAIDWMLKDSAFVPAFDAYVTKMVKSHYVIEDILPLMKKKYNIIVVIEHIVKKPRQKGASQKDSNNLASICNEIKEKIADSKSQFG